MYKVLILLKRKPGITREQFRDHYENSHSVLGQKYLGHLLLSYKRNYVTTVLAGGALKEDSGPSFMPTQGSYDCVTEWITQDEAAFDELMALFADPAISRIFFEDEEHFLDRDATVMIKCDCRDTGTGDGAETLRLRGINPT